MHKFKNQLSIGLLIGLLMVLSACDGDRVFEPGKYDRNSANFGKVIPNRNGLIVCTIKAGSEGRKIAQNLARKECAKFGKRPVYKNYSVATCPLTTASSWHFDCQTPKELK